MRQGVYCLTSRWSELSASDRHAALCRSVLPLYSGMVALSHVSAAVAHGAPTWGLDLREVHLTSLDGAGERTVALVRHHRGVCRVGDVTRRDGRWITTPTRAALEVALVSPRDPAVAVLDWFLQQRLTTLDALLGLAEQMRQWPDSLHVSAVLGLADGRSESVAETRTRLLIADAGLPDPVPQLEILDRRGRVIARVDFAWPEYGLIVEFDGEIKYRALRRAGESIEDCVLREKRREDAVREATGWRVLRLTWRDLDHPAETAQRIRAALRRPAA